MLALTPHEVQLVIASAVLDELTERARRPGPARIALDIVRQAMSAGVLSQEDIAVPQRSLLRGLSPVDMGLLRAAYAQRTAGAALATDDRPLLEAAEEFRTPAFSSHDLLAWIAAQPAKEASDELRSTVRRFQIAVVALGVAAAFLAIGAAFVIARYGPDILTAILRSLGWLSFPLALPVGLGLFALRAHHRFIYGAAEVVFGMTSVTLGVIPLLEPEEASIGAVAAIGAGLYVIVRGLDNMDQAKRNPLAYIFARITGPGEQYSSTQESRGWVRC